MIEIYLFIHPLCAECLASEKRILQMIQDEEKKVQFRFVPLLSLHSFQVFLKNHKMLSAPIKTRNLLFEASYSAALDYKAIQLQGKKKGRAYLLKIQESTSIKNKTYSTQLVNEIIVEIGGDLAMFRADRASKSVKKAFELDQQTAKEMGVEANASTVVFNYACDRDFGVLIDEHPSVEILLELFKTNETTCLDDYREIMAPIQRPSLGGSALRLLET